MGGKGPVEETPKIRAEEGETGRLGGADFTATSDGL